jgi:hypothetical protein
MNQFSIAQISEVARRIKDLLHAKKLDEMTLNNLIAECHPGNDEFYLGLDWLARENEILFLVTPRETYVLPVGRPIIND